jgi:hypothetical protein
MAINLSRITKVNPREIWKHEALDFTQWLAREENISILCEELGIEIENVKSEASAGRYNVDIIADEIDSKRKVIIENQLEPTDHKHLGQILTYASAFDASIIIWIVTDFTEEHRQAIDWFNRNIAQGISFFLIQIEVYKIGESTPAPKFNLICEPNDWGKTMKKSLVKIFELKTASSKINQKYKYNKRVHMNMNSLTPQLPRACRQFEGCRCCVQCR